MNDFMLSIINRLTEEKGLEESSAIAYVSRLKTLNNAQLFRTLSFLRKTADILEKIKPYAFNTQKGFITAVVSVLSLVKDTPSYKKAYTFYSNWLETAKDETMKAQASQNIRTKREQDNWITWNDVISTRDTLKETISKFCDLQRVNENQYNSILHYFVLALYTYFPPRRNQDYQKCLIVHKLKDTLPKTENYLVAEDGKFVFNVYKTAKTYGTETISFKDNTEFQEALACYLKHHPLSKGRRTSVPLLVSFAGTPLTQNNSITRILNAIFGKSIGSSMLRHIYLSSKYGGSLAEMTEDSRAMSHSLNTQRGYIRNKDYVVDEEDAKAVEDALREIESS